MISIADLAMNYGKKTLFEKSSVTFNPGKSYGLVGANGSGKSTLLRLIAGEEKPNSGTISVPRDLKLGVLRQDHFQYENIKVIDVVLLGKPALCEALREKEKILESENLDSQSGHRGQRSRSSAFTEVRGPELRISQKSLSGVVQHHPARLKHPPPIGNGQGHVGVLLHHENGHSVSVDLADQLEVLLHERWG